MFGITHLTQSDFGFIGLCLEGFFYGIYSAIFAMYLQYQASKNADDRRTTTSIIFYSLCILYVLTVVQVASDMVQAIVPTGEHIPIYTSYIISNTISGCCDFMGQSILIYRCWIVWNRDIRVVIIPSILAFSFLVIWVAPCGAAAYDASADLVVSPNWGHTLTDTSLAMSLAVNALVTGLIVLKIVKVYWEVKPLYGQTFSPTGSKLRPIIFVIIESGMALFSIQLARLVVILVWTDAAIEANQCIISIHQMLNGITPTIIQVRVSMGLSFHDQPSLAEVASDLRFGSDPLGHSNSIHETGSRDIDHQENTTDDIGVRQLESNDIVYQDNDFVGVQRSNDDNDITEVRRDAIDY